MPLFRQSHEVSRVPRRRGGGSRGHAAKGPQVPSGAKGPEAHGPHGPHGRGAKGPKAPRGPYGPIELYTPQEIETDRELLASLEDYEATLLSEVHTARRYTHARSARRSEKRRELESEPETVSDTKRTVPGSDDSGKTGSTGGDAKTPRSVRELVSTARGKGYIKHRLYREATEFLKGHVGDRTTEAFLFMGTCLCHAAAMELSREAILYACTAIMNQFNQNGVFSLEDLLSAGWSVSGTLLESIAALSSACMGVAASFMSLIPEFVVGPNVIYGTSGLCSHIRITIGTRVSGIMVSLHITLGSNVLYWCYIIVAFFFISLVAEGVTMLMTGAPKESITRRISDGASSLKQRISTGLNKLREIANKKGKSLASMTIEGAKKKLKQKGPRKLLIYGAVASVFIGILIAILNHNSVSLFPVTTQAQDIINKSMGTKAGSDSPIWLLVSGPQYRTREWILDNAAPIFGAASSFMTFFNVPIIGSAVNMTYMTESAPRPVEQQEAMIDGLYAAMSNSTSPEGTRNLERAYKGTVEKLGIIKPGETGSLASGDVESRVRHLAEQATGSERDLYSVILDAAARSSARPQASPRAQSAPSCQRKRGSS